MNRFYCLIAINCFGNSFPIFAKTPPLITQHLYMHIRRLNHSERRYSPTDPLLIDETEASVWGVVALSTPRSDNEYDESSTHIYQRRPKGPAINSSYELKAKIPVIGMQRFSLRIINDGLAELVIDGLLQVKDLISYNIDQNGEFAFELSEKTNGILKRFRTTLVKVKYSREDDTPTVVVRPPLPTNIQLRLKRKRNFVSAA